MTKAKGSNFIAPHAAFVLLWLFLCLLVPASAQEPERNSPPASTPPHAPSTRKAQEEEAPEESLWDSIKKESNPEAYKNFLSKYPQGQFSDAALSRLGALLGQDYVTLFKKRSKVNLRWSGVEQQLTRVTGVIPRLIGSLQSAGVQEREVYSRVAETRAQLLSAMNATPQGEANTKTPEQKRSVMEAAANLNRALAWLDLLPENYPQLLSNENVVKASDELMGAGNRVFVTRVDYNDAVREYNDALRQPAMAATAESHGFTEEPHFKPDERQPRAPKIEMNQPAP